MDLPQVDLVTEELRAAFDTTQRLAEAAISEEEAIRNAGI